MQNKPIYLDYHSTTPVDQRIINKIIPYMSDYFGNPNSLHIYGITAQKAIEEAKKNISELINCRANEIIFTSGATESINLAILGSIKKKSSKHKIAVLPIEHKAVLSVCEYLERIGICEIIYLKIDDKGRLDLEYLEKICSNGLSLLSVMAVNNEIGNIYPIEKIGNIAEKYKIPFFCDATQAIGKINVDFDSWKTTFLAMSAHKIYSVKGSGALIVKKEKIIEPIMFGGEQQKGIRPGTLNVPSIVALGEACYLRNIEMLQDEAEVKIKRDKLYLLLKSEIPEIVIIGDKNSKISGNLSISIPNIPNDILISRLRNKLAISTGSTCSSNIETASHVLTALKLPSSIINGTIRICLGKFTTESEVYKSAYLISEEIKSIRKLFG